MNAEVEMLIEMLLPFTNEERLEIFDRLKETFCLACGRDSPGCQCQNDE